MNNTSVNTQKNIKVIINEISSVLEKTKQEQVELLISEILCAKTIIVCGAGRVGMAIRGFGMRLGHLGLKAYSLGDSTVPSISTGDLLIVASGSGETQSIFDIVAIAKKNQSRIAAITGNPESRIGKIADIVLIVQAPSKTKMVNGIQSIQPMTTLNEQSLYILFDAICLDLMATMGESHESMWLRHSNLE
jgi:6-phospho-3-hexuloisomerase